MARPRRAPGGLDHLGLRRVQDDLMLPVLVAAMAFLAALALAGAAGATAVVRHWQAGAAAAVTVQVPDPTAKLPAGGDRAEETRLDRALGLLRAEPGVVHARALSEAELADLLRPWLGEGTAAQALPLPAVIEVRLADAETQAPWPGTLAPGLAELRGELQEAVPGTLVESHGGWVARLGRLGSSLQACALLALAVVAGVAAAVVMVGVRTGLLARRDSIEIVHGLGATDSFIAGRFALRATLLAGLGGLIGAACSVPVLLRLAALAAPFMATGEAASLAGSDATLSGGRIGGWAGPLLHAVQALPSMLRLGLLLLPAATSAIGYLTAQATVRDWLRRLP